MAHKLSNYTLNMVPATTGNNMAHELYNCAIKYPYSKKYIQSVLDDLLETKLAGIFDKLVR